MLTKCVRLFELQTLGPGEAKKNQQFIFEAKSNSFLPITQGDHRIKAHIVSFCNVPAKLTLSTYLLRAEVLCAPDFIIFMLNVVLYIMVLDFA